MARPHRQPSRAPEHGQPPIGEGELKLAMTLTVTAAIAITGTAQANHSTDTLRHSRDVVRFFQNHSWLRAPNQTNCQQIPWTTSCRTARRLYTHHKVKIKRLEQAAWLHYQYDWQAWLPDKWARIGACETGYGRRPGNWQHNSGAYQGAFGFAVQSWDSFVPHADPKAGPYPSEAYEATPRQQYEVALAIYRRYGLSGWGCRDA